jgi:hypothetical protein
MQSTDQFGVFCVSLPPRHEITQGVLYIVSLGQVESTEIKIALKGCMTGEMAPHPHGQEVGQCGAGSFPPRCVPH